MRSTMWLRLTLVACLVLALPFAVAACGGSSNSSTASSTSTEEESGGEPETEEGAGGPEAATAAAKKVVAPYIGKPSPFPVTEKLDELPKGATIAFMDCGLPTCALFYELMQEPASMLGVHLERINSGETATTITSAFDSVVAKKPDAVIVPANNIQLWTKQLKELQDANIPVVTIGVAEAEKYGIVAAQSGQALSEQLVELMANYIPAEMSDEANVDFIEVPELSLTTEAAKEFVPELEKACPKCTVRVSHIPASGIGSTSANEIVSDLQAHPETNVVVSYTPEPMEGLPSALETAGLEVETLSAGTGPVNLQQIKEGKETGLGFSAAIASWSLLDLAARQITGQEPTGPEAEGLAVIQFLTEKDITFDPSKGFIGYPNYPEMFGKLWGVKPPN